MEVETHMMTLMWAWPRQKRAQPLLPAATLQTTPDETAERKAIAEEDVGVAVPFHEVECISPVRLTWRRRRKRRRRRS
jgi:hypothetical protein